MDRTTDAVSRQTERPGGRIWRKIVALYLVCVVLLIASFAFYLGQLRFSDRKPDRNADGIVVLTGGAYRVSDAVDLLAGGFGKRLLISGVYPTNDIYDISRSLPDSQGLLTCCVDLDRSAVNTRSNAVETRRWVIERGFKSLIVVTSNYHMPRALTELSHEMPDIELIPFAVVGDRWREDAWWTSVSTWRLLLSEYAKYVAVALRVRLEKIGIDIFHDHATNRPAGIRAARALTAAN